MSKESSIVASKQGPLRELYSKDSTQAISLKEVRTVQTPTTDVWHGSIEAVGFPSTKWDYGIDSKLGGYDDLPNPGHLLCAALAGCLDSTVRSIADYLNIEIDTLQVNVYGEVDVRGCLAMDSTVRAGFQHMRCEIQLRLAGNTDPRLAQVLIEQSELLCVTLDTLRSGTSIEVTAALTSAEPEPAAT